MNEVRTNKTLALEKCRMLLYCVKTTGMLRRGKFSSNFMSVVVSRP